MIKWWKHIVEYIYKYWYESKFDCLKELNDLMLKLWWNDVWEMYFEKQDSNLAIWLWWIMEVEWIYYPFMSFSYRKSIWTYKEKELKEDIKKFLEGIWYWRIIDEDVNNGFMYNFYYLLDKYLSIKILARKWWNMIVNHELEWKCDLSKFRRLVSEIKREWLNYYNDILK